MADVNNEWETIRTVAQLASTAAALVAILLGLRAERRNHARFKAQIELSEKVALANVRPFLQADFIAYEERKAILLNNHGSGAAVITSMRFVRGDRVTQDMSELIELDEEITWIDCPSFGERPEYLAGKGVMPLLDLTDERLVADKFSASKAARILESVEEQLEEIEVRVTYEDIFGNVIGTDEVVG